MITDFLEKEREDHFEKTMEQFQIIENEAGRKGDYQAQLEKSLASEKEVTDKLNQFLDRSDKFQNIMNKTNEFFNTIKKEMTGVPA